MFKSIGRSKYCSVLLAACLITIVTYLLVPPTHYVSNYNSFIIPTNEKNFNDQTALNNNPPSLIKISNGAIEQGEKHTQDFVRFNRRIRILFYTSFFGENPWPFFYKDSCKNKIKCEIIYDTSQLKSADVVFFHGPDTPEPYDLEELKREIGNKTQYWVYFVLEPPQRSPPVEKFNKYFHFASSYRRNSDFFFPYGWHRELSKEEKQIASRVKTNFAEGKTKTIAWIVSHCHTIREKLVKVFADNDFPIDVGGDCSFFHTHKIICSKSSCKDSLHDYKFYFAIENNICTDYITEKYWENAFDHNVIPVMAGPSSYFSHLIKGSYINAFDFQSPKHLIDYLKEVNRNDSLFNQYFEWKKTFRAFNYSVKYTCFESFVDFCDRLHDGIPLQKDRLLNSIKLDEECTRNQDFYHRWVARSTRNK